NDNVRLGQRCDESGETGERPKAVAQPILGGRAHGVKRVLVPRQQALEPHQRGYIGGPPPPPPGPHRTWPAAVHHTLISTLCTDPPVGLDEPSALRPFAPCMFTSLIEGWRPFLCGWVSDCTCWLCA